MRASCSRVPCGEEAVEQPDAADEAQPSPEASQLIRVFGGARKQGPEVVRIGPNGNKYTCSETDLFPRSVPLPLMTPVQGLQDATDGQDVKRGSRSGARGLGRCIDSLDVRDTGASELNRERASPRGGASTPGYSWPSVVV
jgi:hypothetical protein